MLFYKKLSGSELLSLLHLTFPLYKSQIESHAQKKWVGIGAFIDKEPVGLALAETEEKNATLCSLFVLSIVRQRGIGKELLHRLEQELKKTGHHSLSINYTTKRSEHVHLERLLHSLNWPGAEPHMIFYEYNLFALDSYPFADFPLLSKSYAIFPFEEITSQEREMLRETKGVLYTVELDPFQEEEKIESLNSLGLRYQDQLIGWLVTHRIAHDTIRYTTLFVKEEFRCKGCPIALLAESMRRQFECRPFAPRAVHGSFVTSPLTRLAEKRLGPYCEITYHSKKCTKILANSF